jgi:hypothetical protein
MIPETFDAQEVRLYRSGDFPFDWEFKNTLLSGQYADPTIFRQDDRWWLFACDTPHGHRSLRLFSAPDLAGPWEEHPSNPIIADKRSQARPAGCILSHAAEQCASPRLRGTIWQPRVGFPKSLNHPQRLSRNAGFGAAGA